MTTSPVMTVTDELLAELEESASNATAGPWSYDGSYVCTMRQDGETVYVESWNPVADALLSKNVKYISAANPAAIAALTAELRRLRAENAELAKDAGRYRWIVKKSTYGISYRQCPELTLPIYAPDHRDGLGDAIDTAMAAQ